jgi:hypothetical protein
MSAPVRVCNDERPLSVSATSSTRTAGPSASPGVADGTAHSLEETWSGSVRATSTPGGAGARTRSSSVLWAIDIAVEPSAMLAEDGEGARSTPR